MGYKRVIDYLGRMFKLDTEYSFTGGEYSECLRAILNRFGSRFLNMSSGVSLAVTTHTMGIKVKDGETILMVGEIGVMYFLVN